MDSPNSFDNKTPSITLRVNRIFSISTIQQIRVFARHKGVCPKIRTSQDEPKTVQVLRI